MRASSLVPLAIAAFAALGVAALGSSLTDMGPWYQSLDKPDWTPPDFVFPIAWTLILALTALAGFRMWEVAPNTKVSDAVIGLFALNGFLNVLWSLLFFRAQRPDWAFYDVALLWLSIVALIVFCARHSRLSAIALIPYLIWVSIAGALNWEIVQLNAPFG